MFYEKYSQVAVKVGVNVQPGQYVVVSCPIECADFARCLVSQSYKAGAAYVFVSWDDDAVKRKVYENTETSILADIPQWNVDRMMYYAKKGACFISVYATDPELFTGIDSDKLKTVTMAANKAYKEYYDRILSNINRWVVVSVPVRSWADKVFPDSCDSEKLLKNAIIHAMRLDTDDPVKAWMEHSESSGRICDAINKARITKLVYKNSIGTDITIGLPKNNIWIGSAEKAEDGVEFIANLPTQEVFSAPDRRDVNGTVVSSMPLSFNGNMIENFSITFKDGEVVAYTAEKGEDTLKSIIEIDDGMRRLGEVALVAYDSPISNLGILFYNTLFDENASCHLALGSSYPSCIEGGTSMSKEELMERGLNDSQEHVDFMIGTKDLNITGYDEDGNSIAIFRNGNFAEELL